MVEMLWKLCCMDGEPLQVYVSVSGSDTQITNLSEKYRITSLLCRLGLKENRRFTFEEESGIWRILLGIQDRGKLKYYKEQVLGELERIDAETETVYMKLLENYLEANGNVQEAASGCYLHRNTAVSYTHLDVYKRQDYWPRFCGHKVMGLLSVVLKYQALMWGCLLYTSRCV